MVGGSVFGGRWVGSRLSVCRCAGESMVDCQWLVGQWKTCPWVGSRLSVVGGLTVVGGFVISQLKQR